MKRRSFLQISAMTAASALLSGCQSGNEKLIPYLIPPDEGITPGLANYYASSCRSCPAGCGILVRVSEGRAKKIEGNPDHPVNRGKLCARGQAALQELYHPDRVTQPLKRSGPRGSGQFSKITWAEGLGLLTGRLKSLQNEKGTDRLALLTPPLRGTMATLAGGFMRAFGSTHQLSYELLAPDWLRAATRTSFGQPSLPWYDLAETRYLLSFGAEFVDSHLSPVHYGNAFGRMRQERDTVRGHFTYAGARLSLTGASADRWMPARPGSEGALALGLARIILDGSLYDRGALTANGLSAAELLARLQGYDLPRVAKLTGLSEQVITEVAREFAGTRPALAMAGEGVAFQSNGPESVRAIELLNLLVGNLNRQGGIYPDAGFPAGPENSFPELLSLVDAMRGDRIALALIQGNPVHTVPPATGFQAALARVPYVVSFSSLLDDTALQADLILPDHAALESWGDVIPLAGTRQAVLGLMQPVVVPVFDTRQFPDVLLAAASELGGGLAAALPYRSYQEMLKAQTLKRVAPSGSKDSETLWESLLQKGGYFAEKVSTGKGYRWLAGAPLPNPGEPRFAGDEAKFPLHLQVYPTTAFHDGRGAVLPWLQQLPDPMTTAVWDSWVEINPKTAAALGIGFGDLVEVSSPQGSLRLPAVIYPGIRPDLVAIPMGQGQQGGGRYAKGRGVNPLALLAMNIDQGEPTAAWNATRVRVARISENGGLVTAGHPQGSYRSDLIGI
jgi:menaquinone reductase, molybdopterin-binding-like subunit